jgi:hypothetical protein
MIYSKKVRRAPPEPGSAGKEKQVFPELSIARGAIHQALYSLEKFQEREADNIFVSRETAKKIDALCRVLVFTGDSLEVVLDAIYS